jgi:hypothetical protein
MGKTARLLPLVLTATALVPLPFGTPDTPDDPASGPLYQEIPLDGPSVQARTARFGMVGITWPEDVQAVTARVRIETDGRWTDWQPLQVDDDHGPDPSAPEGIQRAGTEPLWVGNATGVQASAVAPDGKAVSGAKVVLIRPDALASDSDDPGAPAVVAARRAPYPMPLMVSRRRWGADERLRTYNGAACARPKYGSTVRAAFVHHTADRNNYTRTDVPAMVRAMYTYHVRSRGWCDLGYNFLVDRFGRIFEGRYGAAQLPVVGAHTASYNTDSVGIAAIGNFDQVAPPPVLLESIARLIAWKFDANYRSPKATIVLAGRTLSTISGHRDTKATACPGALLYQQLGWLRRRVFALMGGSFRTPIYRSARKLGFGNVGQPFWGEHPARYGWVTYFGNRDLFHSVAAGTHSTAGAFRSRYRRLGDGNARLGLPVTEAYQAPGGARQKFQRGWLVWDRHLRQVRVVYGRAR